jgi:hypothetical protein
MASLGRFLRQQGVPQAQAGEIFRAASAHSRNGRITCELSCCVPADLLPGFQAHIGDSDEQLRMLTDDVGH